MLLEQLVPVLQLSISPVIVISGAGLVLLSMTNRLGRVIDRSRILADVSRKMSGDDVQRLQSQLGILIRRGRWLRLAIIGVSLSLLLAALLIIALFLITLMGWEAASLIIVLFISCMLSLIAGLILFIIDLNISLSALQLEIHFSNSDDARP
jgi:hypothetical protein